MVCMGNGARVVISASCTAAMVARAAWRVNRLRQVRNSDPRIARLAEWAEFDTVGGCRRLLTMEPT